RPPRPAPHPAARRASPPGWRARRRCDRPPSAPGRRVAAGACSFFDHAFERLVMIIGVIELARLAGDDAPSAAVVRTRRLYRVFTIVAARRPGKPPFAVVERDAVARMGKGTAGPDERNG